MKKAVFVLICLLLRGLPVFGQSSTPFESKCKIDPNFPKEEHGSTRVLNVPDTTPKRPFDVLSYNVLLDWRAPFQTKTTIFKGWNEVTILPQANTDSIVLDATEIQIDTFWFNGSIVQNPPQPDANEHLTIPLQPSLRDSLVPIVLKFAYSRTSTLQDGFYFYPKGTISTLAYLDTIPEDVAYTMSEPLDAHKWMPCMDLPYQKAASKISIIVPAGNMTVSNGTLVSEIHNPDGSITDNWQSDEPIATYLMVAGASNYVKWQEYYVRVSNPADTVPVVFYAWLSDTNHMTRYNAVSAFENTPLMLKAFSQWFGEYPFVKYGQNPVEPFEYGGMEHQTMTTIHRLWFDGNHNEDIAHELMHHWFGDKTTCETWSDIWLNEGFATWAQALWDGVLYGPDSYRNTMEWLSDGFFTGSDNTIPVYNPPIANLFNYSTTYAKAACAIYMLSRVVHDDTLFFNSLRDYSSHFAYSTANTAQFFDFMATRLGMDLSTYADEWIYGAGYPIYQLEWGQKSGDALEIQVVQQQSGRSFYTMPLTFIAFHAGLPDTLIVQNDARTQTFFFNLPYTADSLQFDSTSVIASKHTLSFNKALSVQQLPGVASSMKLMLQLNTSTIDCRFLPLTSTAKITLYNALGQELYQSEIPAGSSTFQIPTARLASSAYLVRLSTPEATDIQRIAVIR